MVKLDLEKYGLSYLENKNIHAWTDSDIDKLLDAFANETIAPTVDLPFTPPTVKTLLAKSYCRRCGKCCLPNPLDPDDPGVMVSENELKLIAEHSNFSYKQLKKKSVKYKNPDRENVRHLPLPCMFYHEGECQVYNVRPLVCKIYPITDSLRNGKPYIAINVRCDYGKDLYKSVVNYLKKKSKNPLFLYQ